VSRRALRASLLQCALRLKISTSVVDNLAPNGSFCEGLSDTCLCTGFAASTAWRVLDKPQGRKPRAFMRCGAAGLIYGDLTIVCDRFGGMTCVW